MIPIPIHYRRVLGYLRPYVFPFALLLGTSMIVLAGANAAIPFVIKHFVDDLTHIKTVSELRTLSFALAGLFLCRALGTFTKDYLTSYVTQKLVMDVRADLNESLQRQSLSFFNRTPTGVMVSRVINDSGVLVNGLTNGAFSVFGEGISLIALVGTAFYMDWRLALIMAVGFPIAVGPVVKFSRKVRKETKNAQQQLGGLQSILHETFQGNRVVKAFGMEDYERRRFKSELRHLFRINMRVARIKAVTGPMIEAMGAFAVVAVVWYATNSLISGTRTLGSFSGFFTTMLFVYNPFKKLSKTNNRVQQGMAAAERVFGMMDEPSDVPDDPQGVRLVPATHAISFEHVSFRYGVDWVLHDINFEIGGGQVIALVGMSGGGKSTIADLIPRFYDVQDGRITVDGTDVRRIRLASLRGQIGLVTQHTFLFNDTIRANIGYGSKDDDLDQIMAAARLANAHDFIMRLPQGYDTIVGEMGVRLSGGERQRIAIARALLKNAPILILDEATSSLDSESEHSVQEALEHLMKNRTTLVIAHRLSTVRRADRIFVIVHGRIVEQGTHDELFALEGEYRKLCELQFVAPEEAPEGGRVIN